MTSSNRTTWPAQRRPRWLHLISWRILSALMLAGAFYIVYRPQATADCRDGRCSPAALRRQRIIVWIAAVLMLGFAVFSSIPMEMSLGG